jgi:hypothetical protein
MSPVDLYHTAVEDTGVPSLMFGYGLVLSCVHYGVWVPQCLSVSVTIHNSVKTTYVSDSSLGQRNIMVAWDKKYKKSFWQSVC